MNQVERLLTSDLNRLLDRVATSVPEGCLGTLGARGATLRRRLDEAEAQLAAIRATLLDDYGRWQRALDDLENLWALAGWRAESEDGTALAA
jgi:hypothetical protein